LADGEERRVSPPVGVLLGAAALESGLFDLASRAGYLHLASHHLADVDEWESRSGLALAAPATPTPQDDGFLALVDVLERWRGRLDACEMVVLSACGTNVGNLRRDEGVFALPLGFAYAGCPTVVASLWSVPDRSTADLMTELYRQLARNGDGDKLRALAVARKALREAGAPPDAWAPFILLGSPD
jgi:CHAT domain-containing protein